MTDWGPPPGNQPNNGAWGQPPGMGPPGGAFGPPGGAFGPPGGLPPMGPRTDPVAIVALVSGVLSLMVAAFGLCCGIFFCISGVLGTAGIACGVVSMMRVSKQPELYGGKGLAIGGIATGAMSLLITLLLVVLMAVGVAMSPNRGGGWPGSGGGSYGSGPDWN